MDRSCQVDTITSDYQRKIDLAEKRLKEKAQENKTLQEQISFIWRQIEKLEKLQQGSLNEGARSRSSRRNLCLARRDSEAATSVTQQTDAQTNPYSQAALTARPPMSKHQNLKAPGKGKMIKQ